VQPVSHLHGDDPGIGRRQHRHHLGQLTSLPPPEAVERCVLCHHLRDSGAEAAPQRGPRGPSVLDRVVQQRRAQRLIIDLLEVDTRP